MAKKKKRGRRQGILSKAMNFALILLAFSTPLRIAFGAGDMNTKIGIITRQATFGLVRTLGGASKFDLSEGLQFYGPIGAAFALGAAKKFIMRKFPVR